MLDTISKGIRCRATRDIPSSEGMIRSLATGTIVFELVGGNCHFVNVYWDHGVDSLVSLASRTKSSWTADWGLLSAFDTPSTIPPP